MCCQHRRLRSAASYTERSSKAYGAEALGFITRAVARYVFLKLRVHNSHPCFSPVPTKPLLQPHFSPEKPSGPTWRAIIFLYCEFCVACGRRRAAGFMCFTFGRLIEEDGRVLSCLAGLVWSPSNSCCSETTAACSAPGSKGERKEKVALLKGPLSPGSSLLAHQLMLTPRVRGPSGECWKKQPGLLLLSSATSQHPGFLSSFGRSLRSQTSPLDVPSSLTSLTDRPSLATALVGQAVTHVPKGRSGRAHGPTHPGCMSSTTLSE